MNKKLSTSATVFNHLRDLSAKKQEVSPAELLAVCKQLEKALEADGKLRTFTWRKCEVATNMDKKAWRAAARDIETTVSAQVNPAVAEVDTRLIA